MQRDQDLGDDDENVADDDIRNVVFRSGFFGKGLRDFVVATFGLEFRVDHEVVGQSDGHESGEDDQDAGPPGPGELVSEDASREESGEDDDRASEHLEGRGRSQRQAEIHQAGGHEVEHRRWEEEERVEVARLVVFEFFVSGLEGFGVFGLGRTGFGLGRTVFGLGKELVLVGLADLEASLDVVDDDAERLAHEHAPGLEERVSEGSLDSVVADRLDDVRPLQTNKEKKIS